jgi:integrase
MRFSEATALTGADTDADTRHVESTRPGSTPATIGRGLAPKTKKSIRTISLPPAALEVVDLTASDFLFTNGAGNPVRAQEFYNGGP